MSQCFAFLFDVVNVSRAGCPKGLLWVFFVWSYLHSVAARLCERVRN